MDKCLLEVYNNKLSKSEWIEGEVIGYRCGDYTEDFERVDVKTQNGIYEGCHPNCVKVI